MKQHNKKEKITSENFLKKNVQISDTAYDRRKNYDVDRKLKKEKKMEA
jgi:hypothetical protein